MNGDREAFIREIVANPDDELPRLIYADWLEDMGDPQGEFIRLQCARWQGESSSELLGREAELLKNHRQEWIAQLGSGVQWYEFERGLVSDALISGRSLLQNDGLLLTRAPLKSLGTSITGHDQVRLLADTPSLRHLRRLRIGDGPLGDEGIAMLLASPHFPRLEELAIPRCQLRRSGLRQLLAAPQLCELKRLVLTGNAIGDAGAWLIASASSLSKLEVLIMDECDIDVEGAHALIETSRLKSLRDVRFGFLSANSELRARLRARFGLNSW